MRRPTRNQAARLCLRNNESGRFVLAQAETTRWHQLHAIPPIIADADLEEIETVMSEKAEAGTKSAARLVERIKALRRMRVSL